MSDDDSEILILPVRGHTEKRPEWLAPQLPAPPWLGCIQAGVKSGKSVLISNIILNKHMYRHNDRSYWDRIILISPNSHNDESIKQVTDLPITEVHGEYSDQIIHDLEHEQDSYEVDGHASLAHEKPKVLLVLDDLAGDLSRGSAISRLCMRYRQRNLSIIITSQTFRSIPNTCRANASWYILFKSANEREIDKLEEEFNSFPRFRQLYNEATHEKYSFLFLDIRDMSARKRFSKAVLWRKNSD